MPNVYDDIIDDLAKNDPDFIKLRPEQQDSLIEELAQERIGKIPSANRLLERTSKSFNPIKEAVSIGAGLTFPLPQIAQELTKSPLGGPVEYSTKAIQGNLPEAEFNIPKPQTTFGELAPLIPLGFGAANIAKSVVKKMFSKQIAKKELPLASKLLSESIQKIFKESSEGIPKQEFIEQLKNGLSSSSNQVGPQASLFKRWINILEKSSESTVNPNTVEEIETAFGNVAKFGRDPGANPRLVKAAKDINRYASSKFDELAEKSGVPEFITRSKNKSRLMKQATEKPSSIKKLLGKFIEGGALALGGKTTYDIYKSFKD